ncbi:MAG: hypothetical protein U0R19_31435 [Bryobacteraceae bacterium]
MSSLFEKTVAAICEELARAQNGAPGKATEFVLSQWARMPRFLAWPLRLATIAFACSPLPSGLFHRLPSNERSTIIERWRTSAIGPCRDLMRFYRSLALLALYSHQEGGHS